ncbi:MAG: ATP-binding cassette domain-containing protein, partial [Mycobacterium sp.]|nr:ATP-binding cassette domain-containing protein [Mycobacterium sp.]
MSTPLLEVRDLTVNFQAADEDVSAVRGMNFHISPGEVLALVGESGAGKSATAMAVVGLLPEHARVAGSVRLHGKQLIGL